jgi:hypothetical protein
MRRENGMLPRLKAYRRRYGGGLKRYALYHKTQSAFLLAPPLNKPSSSSSSSSSSRASSLHALDFKFGARFELAPEV